MLRKIIIAAAAVTLLAGSATIANSRARHHHGFHGWSYGYSSGERSNPTNTNGF